MTRRLQAPQRRARRAARRNREGGEPQFNLLPVAARSAGEAGMPARPWPGQDIAFLTALLETHNAPAALVKRLVRAAAQLPLATPLLERLAAALADQIHFADFAELLRRRARLLLGPPGAGKTTLAAKLAARWNEHEALLVTTDADRAGGIAQLEEYAGVLGLPSAVAGDATALHRLAATTKQRRLVIDTGGAVPGDEAARQALAGFIAASEAEPILVLPADLAAGEAAAMVRFFAPLGVKALLPTRLYLVRRLGGMLAAADIGRLALPAAGVTPHFAFGLRRLTPEMVARRLLAAALQDPRSQAIVSSVYRAGPLSLCQG
jgi:flagellar biosynthesis protein FlhF